MKKMTLVLSIVGVLMGTNLIAGPYTSPVSSPLQFTQGDHPANTMRNLIVANSPFMETPVSYTVNPTQPWIQITSGSNGLIPPYGISLISFQVDTNAFVIPANQPLKVFTGAIQILSSHGSFTHMVTATVYNANYVPDPRICIDTNNVTMVTNQGTNPANASFRVTNCGAGTAQYQVTESASWLYLSGASGSLTEGQSRNVIINTNAAGLAPGVYSTTLNVNGEGNTLYITVTLTVYATTNPADLCLSTLFLDQTTVAGSQAGTQSFEVGNCGESTLSYTISENISWLSLSHSSGQVGNGQAAQVNVTYNSAGLTPGSYSGVVQVNSNGGSQTLDVNLTVTQSLDPAEVQLSLNALAPSVYEGMNAASQQFTLQNIGEQGLDWQFSDNASWLSLNQTSGTLGGGNSLTITVSYQTANLPQGVWYGDIELITNVGSHTIPVTMTVGEALYLPQTSLKEISHGIVAGNNLPSQSFTLNNAGSAAVMNYTITAATLDNSAEPHVGYLSVSPDTGSISSAQTQTININYDTTTLAVGVYKGALHIASQGASARIPFAITVTSPGGSGGYEDK